MTGNTGKVVFAVVCLVWILLLAYQSWCFQEETDESTTFLFNLYKQKNSGTNERKATLDRSKRKLQFPDLKQSAGPKPFK